MTISTPRPCALLVAAALALAAAAPVLTLPAPALSQAEPASKPKDAEALPPGVALAAAPEGAVGVAEARKAAKPGDRVTVRGRVALGKEGFAAGRGTFTIEDAPATPAPDGAKPAPVGPEARATFRLVDANGALLKADLRGRGGLRPGAEVVVTGTLAEVRPGAPMVVTAAGVHVAPPALPAGFFLTEMPAGAATVEEVKARGPKAGDRVAIRGRIGGSGDPFVAGRAVFTIVGPALKACSDVPGDTCATPWDYCCETAGAIAEHSATVRVPDAAGEPLRLDVKGRGGVKELSDVVVVGTVSQIKGRALVVDATGMHVVAPAAR